MEGHCDHLAIVTGTVPTQEVIKELFFWAFNEGDRDWFNQMDNNGQNEWTEMERKEVNLWIDAHMTKQVNTDAKKAAKNGNHNRDNDGPGNNNNSYKKGHVRDRKCKGGGGNGHDNDNTSSKKSNNGC